MENDPLIGYSCALRSAIFTVLLHSGSQCQCQCVQSSSEAPTLKSYTLSRISEMLIFNPQVKFEAAAPVGETSSADAEFSKGADSETAAPLFPHLYGTIDYASVVRELPVKRSEDGKFLSIEFA